MASSDQDKISSLSGLANVTQTNITGSATSIPATVRASVVLDETFLFKNEGNYSSRKVRDELKKNPELNSKKANLFYNT